MKKKVSSESEFDPSLITVLNVIIPHDSITTDDNLYGKTAAEKTNVTVAANFGFNAVVKQSRVIVNVTFEALDSQLAPAGIKGFCVLHVFLGLSNMEKFIIKNADGSESFAREVANIMVGLAYSTCRGIVFARTQGTIIGPIMLPVVDPSTLFGDFVTQSKASEASEQSTLE